MNKIKSLLIKDLLELKSYKKSILLIIFIYIIIIILNNDESEMVYFGASMITFLFGIYALSTFNYDEKNKTEKYLLTFPITKKELVLEKYILLITSIIIGIIVATIIELLLISLNLINMVDIETFISTILGIIFALCLIQSIELPCIYKYGISKGRSQIYLIMMIIFAIIGGIYILFPNIDFSFLNKIDKIIPYLLILLIFLNYFISYKISLKIINKKEY